MDNKTPGQIHFEFENEGYGRFWLEQDAEARDMHERIAAAVIAHARPQIEKAERERIIIEIDTVKKQARAAFFAQMEKYITDDNVEAFRKLAALPPSHVCVPVEPTEEMMNALNSYAQCEGYIELGYKAMIAGRKL